MEKLQQVSDFHGILDELRLELAQDMNQLERMVIDPLTDIKVWWRVSDPPQRASIEIAHYYMFPISNSGCLQTGSQSPKEERKYKAGF